MSHIQKNSLIVSCQAVQGEALYGFDIMDKMAYAAVKGGAQAIRCNYVNDINSIKKAVAVPTIGIIKAVYNDSDVYITPTLKEVKELLENTDTEVIALDATKRPRPNGEKLQDLVQYIRKTKPSVEIMADISSQEEALEADKLGFDYIGSTMRGYTPYTKGIQLPDCQFLQWLTQNVKAKVIAEGGIWEREQLRNVLKCGVWAVVIGTAITRPADITQRFAKVMEEV